MLRVRVALPLCALFLFAACGTSEPPQEGDPSSPDILEFRAEPEEVQAGSPATLKWKTAGAAQVEIFAGDQAVELGSASAAEGSVEVHPTDDTVYRLVATASDGATREASTKVTVTSVPAPEIVSFVATPATVAPGETAVLSWVTVGADEVRVLAGGTPVELGDARAAEGSVEVKPTSTTTYTLEAYRGESRTTASVAVDVQEAPTIVFTSSADVIDYGASATLSWTVTGADHVVVSDGTATHSDSTEGSGSVDVSPTNRTTFTLTAEGLGGTSSAEVHIDVRPMIASFELVGRAGPWAIGVEVEVEWAVVGAESVTISNLDGFSFTSPLGAGSVAAPVSGLGFRLTAVREGVEAVSDLAVAVAPPPEILEFAATPPIVTAVPGTPAEATISWSVADVETFRIEASIGGILVDEGTGGLTGTTTVWLDRDTTFTIYASGHGLETSDEVVVKAVAPARIDSFRALPSRVGSGESFEISWSTEGAAAVSLFEGASQLPVDPSLVTGAHTVQIAADTDFVLGAVNAAGDLVERTISVEVGAPIVTTFESDPTEAYPGETVTLTWQNLGGVSLVVEGPDGEIPSCTTTDLAVIESGGCPLVVPATGSPLELSMKVENGVGDVTVATVEIDVHGGARILSFTRSASEVSSGDTVGLTWSVSTDSLGRPASLTLVDDLGASWDLADRDPEADTFSVTATTPGLRTYTLTASSLDGTIATSTVDVQVHALPTVTLSAAPVPYDPDSGAPLQLFWTASEATSLALYELDEDGDLVMPAFFEAGPSDLSVGAGVVDLEPRGPITWQALATNVLGRSAWATASVEFIPLDLVSFDVDPIEIVAGDPVTLSWETTGASSIEVPPFSAGRFERASTSAPFIDLSLSPTAQEVDFTGDNCNTNWDDEACPIVVFPDAFVFPFDGADRDQARVYVNGVLSFDLVRTGANYLLEELPSSSTPYVHLAPFWGDLDYFPTGTVYYDTGLDAKGSFLVFQWSHFVLVSGDADLNFQVVLYEDGDFDFRYASMNAEWASDGLGGDASIGHQNITGTVGESITYRVPIQTLPNSGYAFRAFPEGTSGTFTAFPQVSTTYDLTALGYDGTSQTASMSVVVHPAATLSATVSATEVDEGDTILVGWETRNATDVTILDGGVPVHVAAPGDLDSGSFVYTATGLGPHVITVQATGAMGRQLTEDFSVIVLEPFALVSFEADDPAIPVGGATSLSWISYGAETFELTEDGVAINTTGFDFASGSLSVSPVNTAEYVLTVSRADGRSFSQSQTVRVVRANLDSVTVSTTRIAAGGSVDLTWNASSPAGDPVGVRVMPSPMEEVPSGASAFEDISLTGDELTGFANDDAHVQTVQFPATFTFPFLGEEKRSIRIATDGFVSFQMDQDSVFQNRPLPSLDSAGVHLAAFWDDLHSYSSGHVYTELVSDVQGERFIIQWSNFDFWSSSGATGAELTFQIVLFGNGTFEYRYSTMVAPDQDDADGAGATIGFQDPRAKFGHTVSSDTAVAGSLSGRTWRMDAARPLTGTTTVTPGKDGKVEVCAIAEFDADCQTIWLEVIAPGDLLISEIQLDPTNGPDDQWFEIRNISKHAVTIDDMEIVLGAQVHTIMPPSPIVLQPGGYATLAAGASPGFLPDYVYGADILFDPIGGELSIEFGGVALASMEWDSTWIVTPGSSLSLDGAALSPTSVLAPLTDPRMWCDGIEAYSATDFGSPGAAGAGCLVNEYDVDYFGPSAFIDISASGTPFPEGMDWDELPLPGGIPFHFPFYDLGPRTDVWVGSIGYLGFDGVCMPFWGCFVDWDAGMIWAFLDWDFEPKSDSMIYYQTTTIGGRQVMIVQWSKFGIYGISGSFTNQIQLWEGGDIVIAFGEIQGSDPRLFGEEAEIGLFGDFMMQELLFSSYEPNVYEGLALRYHYK